MSDETFTDETFTEEAFTDETFTDETFTEEAFTEEAFTEEAFTDEELALLAMNADPDLELDDDAVPFVPEDVPAGLLPEWYMPAPGSQRSTGRTVVLAGVAIALFVINVGGVCVTYGFPDPVWK